MDKKILVGLLLWAATLGVAQASPDVYLRLGLGFGEYSARGDYLGSRGEPGFDEVDFAGMAGLGVRFQQRFSLEVSRLDLELLPFIDDLMYGVDGKATRWLVGYQHPLAHWAHLGVQAGVMSWDVQVKPSINRGSRGFDGQDVYYGVLLRLGDEQLAFLLGYDRSRFDSIDYQLGWAGLEWVFGR